MERRRSRAPTGASLFQIDPGHLRTRTGITPRRNYSDRLEPDTRNADRHDAHPPESDLAADPHVKSTLS